MILMYFIMTCYSLLNLEASDSQNKFWNILSIIGVVLILTGFISLMVAFWINHKNNVEKPLFIIKPKQFGFHSFFIAMMSFFLFLKTIADDNQIPYIGYLTFLLFLIICYILKINKRYYWKEQEMVNDLKTKEEIR